MCAGILLCGWCGPFGVDLGTFGVDLESNGSVFNILIRFMAQLMN